MYYIQAKFKVKRRSQIRSKHPLKHFVDIVSCKVDIEEYETSKIGLLVLSVLTDRCVWFHFAVCKCPPFKNKVRDGITVGLTVSLLCALNQYILLTCSKYRVRIHVLWDIFVSLKNRNPRQADACSIHYLPMIHQASRVHEDSPEVSCGRQFGWNFWTKSGQYSS